ncbi:MAG: MFS transporter [Acidilobaceae archaeon]
MNSFYNSSRYSCIYVLMANLLFETLGALLFGRLADFYGRRFMFTLALLLEALALIILYFTYENPLAFLVLTSLMTFGIGGEFGAAYSMIAEKSFNALYELLEYWRSSNSWVSLNICSYI